jgi:hypothetical protein
MLAARDPPEQVVVVVAVAVAPELEGRGWQSLERFLDVQLRERELQHRTRRHQKERPPSLAASC